MKQKNRLFIVNKKGMDFYTLAKIIFFIAGAVIVITIITLFIHTKLRVNP